MSAVDRLSVLNAQNTYVGIDFVEVDPTTQSTLWIYFLGSSAGVTAALSDTSFVSTANLSITSTSAASDQPTVTVTAVLPVANRNGRSVLQVSVATPGDFSIYTLRFSHARIDRYYGAESFSFKAGCETGLDCADPTPDCPEEAEVDVPIDYNARDWSSFRRALLEMAALRYPHWKDRLEADAGVMLMEAFAAIGDEMSYYQDRVARERTLASATQRRSVRRHARLVDYELHDGLAASGWLMVEVDALTLVTAGAWATTDTLDGTTLYYQVGRNIAEMVDGSASWQLVPALSSMDPYVWDEDDTCLSAGSTELSLDGDYSAMLSVGQTVILRTDPDDASLPRRVYTVTLTSVTVVTDDLLGNTTTAITWDEDEAPDRDLDLEALAVHGNLLPVVAGRLVPAVGEAAPTFTIREDGEAWSPDVPHAVERQGPDQTAGFLWSLPDTDEEDLCWVADEDRQHGTTIATTDLAREQRPEVLLRDDSGATWTWTRSFVGSPTSGATSTHFTLDDGTWGEVARWHRNQPDPIRHHDLKSPKGFTIRFGDGEFGLSPARGTVFTVWYRLGNGVAGNLAADRSFTLTDSAGLAIAGVLSATNPYAFTNGTEAETLAQAKRDAPQAWRSVTYRAVRAEDYATALERLDWVQRAGAQLRWTGSWLTLFGTPDPSDHVTLLPAERTDAARQLDRYRQAGRDVHVMDPVYAWLDLEITICVEPSSYRGQVKEAVLVALCGEGGDGGFFDPDHWTFGDPLERSALEAAVHGVPGVRAVEGIRVRRRGFFDWRDFDEERLVVGTNEVIGSNADPRYPERGSVRVYAEGGA